MPPSLHIDSQGSGPPVVLLHGWAMHSALWGALATHLARRFRVHAVDLPGHGWSAPAASWTIDSIVAAVRASLEHEVQPLAVVGWSLGGMIALRWAQSDTDRIVRLVLVSTTPRFVNGNGWQHAMTAATLARFGDELRVSYRLTMLRFLTLQLQGTGAGRSALALLRQRFFERPEPSPIALCDALAMLAAIDLRPVLPAIRQPAVVIAGDRDTLVPFAAAEWLAATLPNARLQLMDGAGHIPFLTHPTEFDQAVDRFLQS